MWVWVGVWVCVGGPFLRDTHTHTPLQEGSQQEPWRWRFPRSFWPQTRPPASGRSWSWGVCATATCWALCTLLSPLSTLEIPCIGVRIYIYTDCTTTTGKGECPCLCVCVCPVHASVMCGCRCTRVPSGWIHHIIGAVVVVVVVLHQRPTLSLSCT